MFEDYKTHNLVKPSQDKKICGVQYSLTRAVLFLLTFLFFILYMSIPNTGLLVTFVLFSGILGIELLYSFANHFTKRQSQVAPDTPHRPGGSYAVYIPVAPTMDPAAPPMHEDVYI